MTLADRLIPFTEAMEQKRDFDKMPMIRHVKGQNTQLVASSSGAQSSISVGRHQPASAQGAEAEKKKAKRDRQAAEKETRTGVSKGEAKEEQYRITCTKRYNKCLRIAIRMYVRDPSNYYGSYHGLWLAPTGGKDGTRFEADHEFALSVDVPSGENKAAEEKAAAESACNAQKHRKEVQKEVIAGLTTIVTCIGEIHERRTMWTDPTSNCAHFADPATVEPWCRGIILDQSWFDSAESRDAFIENYVVVDRFRWDDLMEWQCSDYSTDVHGEGPEDPNFGLGGDPR